MPNSADAVIPPAPATAAETLTASAADTAIDPTAIATWRGQIDALDTAIVRLVAERARLSQRIQAARVNAGGARVELGRERAVLGRYRNRLGTEGSALGEAVLRVCRGTR
ncbi:chorismate mutase [Jatrophihabitans sp.]|uniref:chorismate mutase n=1 Tax=Jatrophihabitans sp. TaxID=1932789 RepID=UPI002C564E69|nr:chorismate mutase [Jatrophihabitans sp.]